MDDPGAVSGLDDSTRSPRPRLHWAEHELLRAHVEALFTLDESGRLVRVNEPDGKPAPRFFLGCTTEVNAWWVRHDVTDDVVQRLSIAFEMLPDGMQNGASEEITTAFKAILQGAEPIQTVWSGPAFCFPDHLPESSSTVSITRANADLLRPHLAGWYDDAHEGKTLYAVIVNGEAVSVCASVRETPVAHEAGVETAVPFRGRGYAEQAVGAWARAVRMQNRVPLYSTSWTNTSSRSVALKLGLIQFASDLHFT